VAGGLSEPADHRDGDEAHKARDYGQDEEQAHRGEQARRGTLAWRHLMTLTVQRAEHHVGGLIYALMRPNIEALTS
jgi:hypothetical protein